MKKIGAIIRKLRFEDVKQALLAADGLAATPSSLHTWQRKASTYTSTARVPTTNTESIVQSRTMC